MAAKDYADTAPPYISVTLEDDRVVAGTRLGWEYLKAKQMAIDRYVDNEEQAGVS